MEQQFRRAVREARDRGQTVFLSSHQLAEVEAVCDRVAILRAGRLVEVADVADLRAAAPHRGRRRRTPGPLPTWPASPGSTASSRRDGGRLRFTLTGAPAPALRALAAADVTALRLREPSLEEIFLGYYGDRPTPDDRRDHGPAPPRPAPTPAAARSPGSRCGRSAAAPLIVARRRRRHVRRSSPPPTTA